MKVRYLRDHPDGSILLIILQVKYNVYPINGLTDRVANVRNIFGVATRVHVVLC